MSPWPRNPIADDRPSRGAQEKGQQQTVTSEDEIKSLYSALSTLHRTVRQALLTLLLRETWITSTRHDFHLLLPTQV